MPKRRKATNALEKRALKAMKEPVKGRRKTVKRKTRKAVKGAAKDVLAAYPLHRAVKGAVKALATTVPKKVMGAATTGLGAEAVAQFLKAVAPSSAMGKRLNKALSKDPGKLTDKDIARRRKVKKKRLKQRK